MRNLFVYGSLMYEPVWRRIVTGDFRSKPALLTGYRRLRVANADYPAIIQGAGTVQGLVWLEVDGENLRRLDEFEGEPYARVSGVVVGDDGVEIAADYYEIRDAHRGILENVEWDPREFERAGLARFLDRYSGFTDPK
jgi:gamma-glutamylcyclotransferase (GGCT)/AIG2-like uncharacterized protein YtfP